MNTRLERSILIAVLAITGCGATHRLPCAQSLLSVTELGVPVRGDLPAFGTMELLVRQNPTPATDSFAEDELILTLHDATGNELLHAHVFRSSYQQFHIDVLHMDSDDKPEFVFLTGEGRGPNARSEYLTVYTLAGGMLHERVRVPRSGPKGPSGKWWYDYAYQPTGRGDETLIVMKLQQTAEGWAYLVPPNRQRIVALSFNTSRDAGKEPVSRSTTREEVGP